jgi:micrococcal nuclease
MRYRFLYASLIALLSCASHAQPGSTTTAPMRFFIEGAIKKVIDGDSLYLSQKNGDVEIRLASIDAPETSKPGKPGQPFSAASASALRKLAPAGAQASGICFERDQYNRAICSLIIAGKEIAKEQVRSGYAWANQAAGMKFIRSGDVLQLEARARASRAGLWEQPDPVPPWQFRRDCWSSALNCRGKE